MLNSQCVVMVLVASKQKRITTIMTLELIVTIVRQQKPNKLDKMFTSLKHYIALVSPKKKKPKHMTTSLKVDAIHAI